MASVGRDQIQERSLRVQGVGLVDAHLYRQSERMVLHLVNLTNSATWRTPVHELVSVGPFQIALRLPADLAARTVRSLVAERSIPATVVDGWIRFEIARILDHEVLVIT